MTQAELAQALGVTNKAVSKWETGEAMPETSQLLPISRIFGVSVDELLEGKRADCAEERDGGKSKELTVDEIKKHIFVRGTDDDVPRTLADIICGTACGAVIFLGLVAYLLLGAIWGLWHPYWVIMPVCALVCGIIGAIYDVCNPEKRAKKFEKGENPYTGCVCGVVMLVCIIAYLTASVFTGLWHPLWAILAGGAVICFIVSAAGAIYTQKKK